MFREFDLRKYRSRNLGPTFSASGSWAQVWLLLLDWAWRGARPSPALSATLRAASRLDWISARRLALAQVIVSGQAEIADTVLIGKRNAAAVHPTPPTDLNRAHSKAGDRYIRVEIVELEACCMSDSA